MSIYETESYRRAAEKLGTVEAELTRVESELARAEAALNVRRSKNDLDLEAEFFFKSETKTQTQENLDPVQLADLRHRRNVIQRAVELGRAALRRAEHDVGVELAREAAPEYRKIIQELATAAITLAKIAGREREFRENLLCGGAVFSDVRPMPFLLGPLDLRDPSSMISYYTKELVQYGFMTQDEVERLEKAS